MPCRRAEKGNDSSYVFLQLPPQFQNGDTMLGEMEQKLAVPYSDEPLAPSDAQSQYVSTRNVK